jgi:hypothetical protein
MVDLFKKILGRLFGIYLLILFSAAAIAIVAAAFSAGSDKDDPLTTGFSSRVLVSEIEELRPVRLGSPDITCDPFYEICSLNFESPLGDSYRLEDFQPSISTDYKENHQGSGSSALYGRIAAYEDELTDLIPSQLLFVYEIGNRAEGLYSVCAWRENGEYMPRYLAKLGVGLSQNLWQGCANIDQEVLYLFK